jgi:hypothetical protein
LPGRLDDVRVEAATKAAIGGDHDQQGSSVSRLGGAKQRVRILIDSRHQPVQDPEHLLSEWSRGHDALLRSAQPRRSDHLHRFRDLLRRLDCPDPAPEIDQ